MNFFEIKKPKLIIWTFCADNRTYFDYAQHKLLAHLLHKKSPNLSFGLFVRIIGLEPTRLAAPDPKSGMSTNFTISAKFVSANINIILNYKL